MGFFARLFGKKKKAESAPEVKAPAPAPTPVPAPVEEATPAPAPAPEAAAPEKASSGKKRAAILVGTNVTVTEDGMEHVAEGFRNSWVYMDNEAFVVSGLTARVGASAPGTYAQEITGQAVVRDAKGVDVTDQFKVTIKPGILTILPRV